jgi:hypothetical protein
MGVRKFDYWLKQDIFLQTYRLAVVPVPAHISGQKGVFGGLNPLHAELNPIYHLLALLGAHHILHVSRIRVNWRCCEDKHTYSIDVTNELSSARIYRIGSEHRMNCFISSCGYISFVLTDGGILSNWQVGCLLQTVEKPDQVMLSTVSEEISRQLKDCHPKAIVTLSAILRTVQDAIKLTGTRAKPLIIIAPGLESAPDIPAGTVDLRQMLQDGVDTSDVHFTGNIDDTAALPYSRGTTGLPKGVMLSHRNMVSNIAQINDCREICISEPALGMTLLFMQADSPDITALSLDYNTGKVACLPE